MVTDRQYIDENYMELKPATVYELNPNTHYIIGVVNLRQGVTYSLTFWRETSDYSNRDD